MSIAHRPARFAAAFLLLALISVLPAAAQTAGYTFTHFAGPTGGPGVQDGNGTNARVSGGQLIVDPSGTSLYIYDGASVRRYVFATGEITTLAGAWTVGNQNGSDWNARFNGAGQLAFDGNGRLILAESGNRQIRAVTMWGATSTVAGAPQNLSCQNGSSNQAGFNNPQGLLVDRNTGTMYVGDTWNYTIRKITSGGTVSLLAGSCLQSGFADGSPITARFYEPSFLAFDPVGNIIVADTKNYVIRRVTPAGVVSTVVGNAFNGQGYQDGFASNARINLVYGMAFSPSGELFFSDPFNHTIRKWTPNANTVSTVIGNVNVDSVVDGPVASARTSNPGGIAFDPSGNLYFLDRGALRRLSTGGVVSTLAGSVAPSGTADGVGAAARFNSPRDTALDSQGNIYVADGVNGAVRKITPGGTVTTFAGITGQPGQTDGPLGTGTLGLAEALDVDSQGNVYYLEAWRIRKITPDGTISSFAGNPSAPGYADGVGAAAKFYYPYGLCVGPSDELYVADTSNHVIRKVLPDGTVSTLAGTAGSAMWQDGTGSAARFYFPTGCVYSGGFLYVADEGNNRIRKVSLTGVVTTVAGTGATGGTDSQNGLSATFNQPWGITADAAGHLFVLEYGRDAVRELFPASSYATTWLGPGFGSAIDGTGIDGGAALLFGFASDPNGTLYIPEAGFNGVRKAAPAASTAPAIDQASAPTGQPRTLSITGAAPATVQWEVVRRPIGSDPSVATFNNPTSTSPTFTPDIAGRYRIRMSADGPSGTAIRILDFTATCPSVPTPVITPSVSGNLCPGVPVTLDAGPGYTGYLWSTGETTRTITVAPSTTTTYFVQAFINTCGSTTVFYSVQEQYLNQNVSLSGSFTACTKGAQGGTYTLAESGTATVTGHQWFYRAGVNTNNPAVNIPGETGISYALKASDFPGPGSYLLSVKSVTSCGITVQPFSESVISIASASTPTITASGPTTFCAGGSVTLTSSSASSYLWSTGETTQSITVNASGAYSVTATNSNGCAAVSAATNVTVNPSPVPTITASGSTSLCPGGSVTLTASAASSYLWSNGATTRSITVADAGNYSVTVTSAAGCSGSSAAPVAVTMNPAPTPPTITSDNPDVCPGSTGMVQVSGTWSSITWSFTNATLVGPGQPPGSVQFQSNGAGPVTATVVVTDDRGCSATQSITIPLRTIAPPSLYSDNPDVCPGSTGMVQVSGSWSNVSWSFTNATLVGPGLPPGSVQFQSTGAGPVTATVVVTDSRGCTATQSITIPLRSIAAPSVYSDNPDVCPGSTGFVAVSGSWSDASWSFTNATLVGPGQSPGSVQFQSNGNGPVTATVVVTDSRGCTATQSVTIPLRTIAAPTMYTNYSDVCPGGTAEAAVSGGSWTGYQWSITNGTILGPGAPGAGSVSFQSNGAGPVTVSVVVTDSRGCHSTQSVTIPLRTIAPPTMYTNYSDVCPGGTAEAAVSGGSWTDYQWSITNGTILGPGAPGAGSVSFQSNGAGPVTVSVVVTDFRGCHSTQSVTIPLRTIAPPTMYTNYSDVCPGGTAEAAVSGGSWTDYQWSITNGTILGPGAPGAGSVSFQSNGAGPVTVSVVVTDFRGCHSTQSVTIPLRTLAPPAVTASGSTALCAGGSVTLNAPSGFTGYSWSNGATTQSITVSDAGTYTVSVTDFRGCSASSAPTTVTVNANPTATISASGSTTFCAGGSVTLTASGGASYLWSNGATSPSITVTSSGTYSVTATASRGCSATSAAVDVVVNAIPSAAITADGPTTFCTGGSVNLSAPAGAASYLWSTGEMTRTIHVTAGGTYSVTVTGAGGCTASSAQSVNVYPPPSATITPFGPTTFCQGGNVMLSAGGPGPYLWSTGETTRDIFVSTSGTVTLTVSNSLCSSTASVNVNVLPAPPKPVITADGPLTFCAGGSVTLTAPAGYSYSWSNPPSASTQSIVATTSGHYTVTILSANGCWATSDDLIVTVLPAPSTPIVTASGPTTFCEGGSVTLTAPAASSYLWSNGATTQSITATTSGSYSVTVTNASGCSSAASTPTLVTVNANPSAPAISASGPTTFCAGGSVTLTASAGSSYLWSTGATTQSITVTTAGNYSVTVTNASGCSATSAATTVTVNANPTATISASGPTTFCAGGSVTLTASAGSSYLWSTGATTQSISVAASGNYSVTVTNASGCSATSAATNVTVNANPAKPVVTASGPTSFCAGGSVTLTAPAASSYFWSNGATTQSITVNASGSYSVTVTNASGCSAASDPVSVIVNGYPSATITPFGSMPFCPGGGTLTLASPQSSGYTYLWSTGETTANIDVHFAGTYTVTITNAAGCSTTSAPFTVTTYTKPTAAVSGSAAICAGGNATLRADLTGTAPWSVTWSDGFVQSNVTTPTLFRTVSPGFATNYTITQLLDSASNCVGDVTGNAAITVNANPSTPAITAGGPTTFCAGGSVTLTAPSSTSYLWSNGATTQSIVVNASGSYTVTVTNASGCSATSAATNVTVNAAPSTPTITAGGPTTFCAGGSVTLTAPSSSSYLWSNGATTQSIVVNASGSYSVTVTNASGCSATSAATNVTVNANPSTPTITAGGPTTFCAGGSVTLTAPSSSAYLWSNGATTQSIVVNASGSYSVTVTNASGCSATSAATNVTVNAVPSTPTITAGGPTTFCAGGSVTLIAPSSSSYLWSNGATTQAITVSASGSYSVTVKNASGCSATSAVTTVTVNANPSTPAITAGGPTTFCAGGSVTLTAPSSTSYLWSNGATTQSIVVNAAGSYSVTVKNASGCSATSAATNVTVNAAPSITGFSPTLQSVTKNHTPQRITVTATGTSLTYQWYSGTSPSTTSPISGATTNSYLPPTTAKGTFKYWVRVTGNGGCTADSTTATVTVN